MASISLRCLKVLNPFWTTSLRCCNSSPTHNRSGLHSIRAITMAATSPIDSVWSQTTTRLSRLSLRRPGVILSCQLVVASPLVVPSLRHTLVILSRQLVVQLPLTILSLRCPLVVLSCQLVVALPLAVLSLRHPLINSLLRLVVASPLLVLLLGPAPPSRPLVAPAGSCVAS